MIFVLEVAILTLACIAAAGMIFAMVALVLCVFGVIDWPFRGVTGG